MSYLKIHSVVNGELYDYENIKSTLLSEHTFNCNSDSEIVTRLYVKYGTDFVRHLRGEFAIIIYDEPKNKLIVVRDRFGIKPVFYTYINGRLVIASEIKAFMGLGWKAEWDVTSLKEAGYFVDNRTVFKNVFKLAPASYMIANSSSMTIKPYYEVTFPHKFDQETRSLEEMILGVRSRLKKAVELRLRSDVPVGIYLSGGIDSSAILGLTTTILREKDPNAKVVAFTISFVDGRNIQDHSAHVGQDEGDIAERMAEFWNADFHKVDVDESDLAGNLEDAIYACENPYWDLNGVAKFILSKRVQDYGIKVVLTGEGSDEHFAGYSFFKPDSLREQDYSFKFQDSLTNDERVAKLSSLESGSNPWSKMSVVPLSFEDMQIGRRMLGNVSTPRYLCSMFAQIPELFKSHSDQKESTTDFV